MADQNVLPHCTTRTESDCRRALARDLSRLCHQHGPQRVGLSIGCDEKTVRNARDESTTLKLHTALNLLTIDPGALDNLAAEYGFQIIPLAHGSVCESAATATVARPLPKLAYSQMPDSDGGVGISRKELEGMEEELRDQHRMTAWLLARLDALRGIGRRAA